MWHLTQSDIIMSGLIIIYSLSIGKSSMCAVVGARIGLHTSSKQHFLHLQVQPLTNSADATQPHSKNDVMWGRVQIWQWSLWKSNCSTQIGFQFSESSIFAVVTAEIELLTSSNPNLVPFSEKFNFRSAHCGNWTAHIIQSKLDHMFVFSICRSCSHPPT